MKDTDIHEGLENKIMRDTISYNLSLKEGANYKDDYSTYNNFFKSNELILWQIQNVDNQINYLKKLKQFYSDKLGWITLMNSFNWNEWDISDYIGRSVKENGWLTFIGTEQEYEKFIEQFEK